MIIWDLKISCVNIYTKSLNSLILWFISCLSIVLELTINLTKYDSLVHNRECLEIGKYCAIK